MNIHYCNTIHKYEPIQDINPLLLEKYYNKKLLIFCAKKEQAQRINDSLDLITKKFSKIKIYVAGWWELKEKGLIHPLTKQFFKQALIIHDAIVILDKKRIDKEFLSFLHCVEKFCKS